MKDLCARLPYGVYVEHNKSGVKGKLQDIAVFQTYNEDDTVKDYLCYTNFFGDVMCKIEYFKPYLFPLSSISDDQKYDFYCRFIKNDCNFDDFKKFYLYNGMWRRKLLTLTSLYDIEAIIEWFHKNYIDYRGLIEKGLAINATGLNIY